MDNNQALKDLTDKVQNGTSTSEEELLLLQNINHSIKMLTKFIEEVKAVHVTK